ncbi:MAG: oligosaccharide flippase family protein [Saprospiraceae bacterium]
MTNSVKEKSPHLTLNHLFRWNFGGSLYMSILQLISIVLLGQFLSYKELGIYTIFQIIFRLALALFEPGMFVSIIQKPGFTFKIVRKEQFIQWMLVILGLILIALFFIWESNYLMMNPIIVLNSLLLFIIIGGFSYYASILSHYLKQKQVSISQMAGASCEFIFIVSTIWYFSPLIVFSIGLLIRFSVYYFVCYLYYKQLGIEENDRISEQEHIRYSAYQVLNQGISFVQGNFDTVLVGSLFGLLLLGPYNFASEISYLLFSKINPIFNRAILPLLSKHQQDNETRQLIITESLLSHALICISIYILLYAHIEPIIAFAFKDPEAKILLFAKYILIMAIIRSVNNIIFNQLLALGESKNLFKWNIVVLIINYLFIGIIFITKTDILTFLLINIFVSLSVLIYTIFKLLKYCDNRKSFFDILIRYILYLLVCVALIFLLSRLHLSLIPSLFCSVSLLFLVSLLFYKTKVLDLLKLRIM